MKKRNPSSFDHALVTPDLRGDVEQILSNSVVEEAVFDVWTHFEKAMAKLDSESQELLERHFQGDTASALGEKLGLSPDQVEAWLGRIKRELILALRSDFSVR